MSGSITAKSRFYGEEPPGGTRWGVVLGLVEVRGDFTPETSGPQNPSGGTMGMTPTLLRTDTFCTEARKQRRSLRGRTSPTELPDPIATWLFELIKRGAGLQISGKCMPTVQRPWDPSPAVKMGDGGYMTARQTEVRQGDG